MVLVTFGLVTFLVRLVDLTGLCALFLRLRVGGAVSIRGSHRSGRGLFFRKPVHVWNYAVVFAVHVRLRLVHYSHLEKGSTVVLSSGRIFSLLFIYIQHREILVGDMVDSWFMVRRPSLRGG